MQTQAPSTHSLTLYTQEDQAALWHCTTNTPWGAFPTHHQGAKHSDPTEFHTGELSLLMELSLPFPPSLPVSGYTWWSWWIFQSNSLSTKMENNSCIYQSTVQLSQHYSQQPFCLTFPTWPTTPLYICTTTWWNINFRGWINAHSVNNPNSLRWTMLRMRKKKGH